MPKKKTVKHSDLYRAQLSCMIARDVIERKTIPPDGVTAVEWALYNMCHAIEDIALYLGKESSDDEK